MIISVMNIIVQHHVAMVGFCGSWQLISYHSYIALTEWCCHWWQSWHHRFLWSHMDGLVQEKCNSIANALGLHLSGTNPTICDSVWFCITAMTWDKTKSDFKLKKIPHNLSWWLQSLLWIFLRETLCIIKPYCIHWWWTPHIERSDSPC